VNLTKSGMTGFIV